LVIIFGFSHCQEKQNNVASKKPCINMATLQKKNLGWSIDIQVAI